VNAADLASVIVATSQLKVVSDIIGAMHRADAETAKAFGCCCGPVGRDLCCDRVELHEHLCPTPIIEPRKVLHPTPRYEPRPVIHPTPRVVPPPSCPDAPKHHCEPPAIQPPWKCLPYPTTTATKQQVKIVKRQTDILHRGITIDFFA
jgi:hypothetical protein